MPTFHRALDGKTGRDRQQCNGGEVTDINAVRRSERHQDRSFWEGFNNHKPDSYGGQREGLEPAAALGRSRHLQRVTTGLSGRELTAPVVTGSMP